MTNLEDLVVHLTEDHKVNPDKTGKTFNLVEEYALLTQLEQAKTMRLNSGGGGGGGAKLPFGVGPVDLQNEIETVIMSTLQPWQYAPIAKLPLPERLKEWFGLVDIGPAENYLPKWVHQIRDLFTTKFHLEATCPECHTATITQEQDGQITHKDALMVTVESQTATCANCGNTWTGVDDLNYLAGKI
ncbi:DUF7340 domain-containing protein [Rothia koreensis]|uniref:DUF7340 domain-containing protein n=1 Tax=Rothia koreensis TaxID=592378 RepID=UPI003FCC47C4